MPMRFSWLAAVSFVFSLLGCNTARNVAPSVRPVIAAPVSGAESTAGGTSPQQANPAEPVSVGGVQSDTERASFERLLSEANSILGSGRFHTNLKSLSGMYPQVYLHFLGNGTLNDRRTAVNKSLDSLSDIVAAKGPYRYVRSPAFLNGGKDVAEVLSGWTGTKEQLGAMSIGRFHLGRWQSTDLVERSCAINTVAHEISHLISNRPDIFMGEVTDDYAATLTSKASDGKDISPPNAVGSYLIGTVAQCTWLQEKGYRPEVDLKACVQVFGHRGHNGLRCQSFSDNREVAVRDDLPAPYVLVDR